MGKLVSTAALFDKPAYAALAIMLLHKPTSAYRIAKELEDTTIPKKSKLQSLKKRPLVSKYLSEMEQKGIVFSRIEGPRKRKVYWLNPWIFRSNKFIKINKPYKTEQEEEEHIEMLHTLCSAPNEVKNIGTITSEYLADTLKLIQYTSYVFSTNKRISSLFAYHSYSYHTLLYHFQRLLDLIREWRIIHHQIKIKDGKKIRFVDFAHPPPFPGMDADLLANTFLDLKKVAEYPKEISSHELEQIRDRMGDLMYLSILDEVTG